MSMCNANGVRTVCEVLRELCDIHQGGDEHDALVRRKLVEAEAMCKRMAKKLYEHNKKFDAGWWAKNPDYEDDLKRRLDEHYLSG